MEKMGERPAGMTCLLEVVPEMVPAQPDADDMAVRQPWRQGCIRMLRPLSLYRHHLLIDLLHRYCSCLSKASTLY